MKIGSTVSSMEVNIESQNVSSGGVAGEHPQIGMKELWPSSNDKVLLDADLKSFTEHAGSNTLSLVFR